MCKHSIQFKIRKLDNGCLVVFAETDVYDNGNLATQETGSDKLQRVVYLARSFEHGGDYAFQVDIVNNFDEYGYYENTQLDLISGYVADWDI